MARLNQVIAAESTVKARTQRAVTDIYHAFQRQGPLNGISRTYQPLDDEGDHLPPESVLVQVKAEELLQRAADELANLWDLVATKDAANCVARGDVVVNGTTVLSDVPVTTLLFLEKQLTDLHALIDKLPVLDPSEAWEYDPARGVWATPPTQTVRTMKVPRAHVLYEATDKHPAQVQPWTEDKIVGTWRRVLFSGAMPAARVDHLRRRVEALQVAVKHAREAANITETESRQIAGAIFEYLFTVDDPRRSAGGAALSESRS